jgi:hypothetical protein
MLHQVFGDQIYVAALVELAGKTQVGKTWALDRSRIMVDLSVTDAGFEDIQRQIESRISGRWNRAS